MKESDILFENFEMLRGLSLDWYYHLPVLFEILSLVACNSCVNIVYQRKILYQSNSFLISCQQKALCKNTF